MSSTRGSVTASVAIFASAFLLFAVELVMGKAALPRFGGTAAVWTTCLFFFQAALLAGYGWAHLLTKRSPRVQGALHVGALVIAALVLVAQGVAWGTPLLAPGLEGDIDVGSVLRFLLVTVGAPFAVLSATTSLVQAWLARAGDNSPWRLYALSNAGSLLALLVYPLVLEPLVGLRVQALGWALGFGGFVVVLVAAAAALLPAARAGTDEARDPRVVKTGAGTGDARDAGASVDGEGTGEARAARVAKTGSGGDARATRRVGGGHEASSRAEPGWNDRLRWLGLSALGTLLLAATTNVMCQELVPTPVLWALPLALYLLSFIITFEAGERLYRPRLFVLLWLVGLAAVLGNTLMIPNVSFIQLVLGMSVMQLAANVLCHARLYEARPAAVHLSSFYLWTAVGGAVGTLAVGALAPMVFDDHRELPIAMVLVSLGVARALVRGASPEERGLRGVVAALAVLLSLGASFALATVVPGQRAVLRNFFGVLRVQEENGPGDPFHAFALRHGNVTHGVELAAAERLDAPTSYYTWSSGLGVALRSLQARGGAPLHVGVAGLGIGTIAALLRPADTVDFYEIDPNVVALAKGQGGWFHFLERSKAKVTVTLGDARLVLQRELAAGAVKKDLLVVDVFSGDAVPAHLFTEEAMALFLAHLRDDGVLALHVSNRHLALERVAFALASAANVSAVLVDDAANDLAADSTWVLVSKTPGVLERITPAPSNQLVRSVPDPVTWTDDHNSVLPVLRPR